LRFPERNVPRRETHMKNPAIVMVLCAAAWTDNPLPAEEGPAAGAFAGEEIAFRLDPRVSSLDLVFEPAGDHALLALSGQAGGSDMAAGPAAPYQRPRLGAFSAHGGVGFTASPETFLFAMGADYFITSELSIGPLLQFGFEDDWSIFAPSLNVRWTFDLDLADPWNRLKPFAEGGIGGCYMHHKRTGDDEEWGFLINFGGGLEYYVTDTLALGTEMLFNFLPGEVQGQDFFFSWQVLTVRFLF
jgi:hypothetical protein